MPVGVQTELQRPGVIELHRQTLGYEHNQGATAETVLTLMYSLSNHSLLIS